MATGKERLHVFENVMARVGLSGDFLGEYFKALSTLNGLQTYNEMNPPQPTMQDVGQPLPTGQTDTPLGQPNTLPTTTPMV
jgi:hypothetical protein